MIGEARLFSLIHNPIFIIFLKSSYKSSVTSKGDLKAIFLFI